MYLVEGEPLQAALTEKVKTLLAECGLVWDASARYTAVMMEGDEAVATGSLDGNVVKCVAVSPAHQGEDLTARIVTALTQHAMQQGIKHLMLYTKPRNQYLFAPLGFHPVVRTADVLLMENHPTGLADFLAALPRPATENGPVGCIVAHGNPFTLGHRYLVETAAAQCAQVYLFILSEDRGTFPAETRLAMAKAACSDLPNVFVCPTGPYMVSAATFPTYFLKDQARAGEVYSEADVRLFGEKIAPALGITRRYVGTEPLCPVTAQYNAAMKQLLPRCGIELIEVERKAIAGEAVSASRVRALLTEGREAELTSLLPDSTLALLRHT